MNKNNACLECIQVQNDKKKERDRQSRRESQRREYVPELQALRERWGYSQSQVAWEAGMPKGTYTKFERLERAPSLEQRIKIFQAFNILRAREEEEMERMVEDRRKLEMAGLG